MKDQREDFLGNKDNWIEVCGASPIFYLAPFTSNIQGTIKSGGSIVKKTKFYFSVNSNMQEQKKRQAIKTMQVIQRNLLTGQKKMI